MDPWVLISKHPNASDSLTVNVTYVILTSDQDLHWTLSGLNVHVSHCELDSLQLWFRKSDTDNTTEIPTIMISNSSV